MRKGCFSWFGHVLPLAERFALIREHGFEESSIWFGEEEELFEKGCEDDMASLARDAGLELGYVHARYSGCSEIWTNPDPLHSEIFARYRRALEYCRRHGIPNAVFHITRSNRRPERLDWGMEFLSCLVREAEDSGVVAAIENTRHNDVLDAVFQDIESPFLGLCYDSSHDGLSRGSFGRLLADWGGLLRVTHLSDNRGLADDHLLPFTGTLDWEALRDSMDWKSYAGCLSLEVVPEERGAPGDFLCQCRESLDRLGRLFGLE